MQIPESARFGPWRPVEILGRGGNGVVYRALYDQPGPRYGEEVALKTVQASGQDLGMLRQEIRALVGLDHPQVVRVIDHGQTDGVPWLAMAYVRGERLSSWGMARFDVGSDVDSGASNHTYVDLDELEEVDAAPLPRPAPAGAPRASAAGGRLREALSLVRALCAPLAWLHGEGRVHRDVKPDNVMVRPDGVPVLVDFGLSVAFAGAGGRERVELGVIAGGTPTYMAPEQIRGGLVDPRADLYALGCVLYELVAGRPPFVGFGPAVLEAHLSEQPVPPSEWVDGVPEALDALVLSLLDKDPARRPGYADIVDAALLRLGATLADVQSCPPARAYLLRPRLVGREAVFQQLSAHLYPRGLSETRVALLAAPSGHGKTRLALELAGAATQAGWRVVSSSPSGSALEAGPLGPLRPALRLFADLLRAAPLASHAPWQGARGQLLASFEPAIGDLLGVEDAVVPLGGDADRQRVLAWVADALSEAASSRPLMLVIDDLHRADVLTLDLLALLARTRRSAPLVVLGTLRDDAPNTQLDRLRVSAGVVEARLGALSASHAGLLVADLLGLADAPPSIARHVAEQAEGSPYFVAELLRACIAEGVLARDAVGRWVVEGGTAAVARLPSSLVALIGRRIDQLDPTVAAALSAAAVLGRAPTADGIAALLQVSADVTTVALAELVRLALLEWAPDGGLTFSQDRVREIVLARLPAQQRTAWHARAAAWLAELANPALLSVRAHHLAASGHGELARSCAREAADFARRRSALDEVVSMRRLAVEAVKPPDHADQVALIEALMASERFDEVRAMLDSVSEPDEDPRLLARLLDERAKLLEVTGDGSAALLVAERALATWQALGDRRGSSNALSRVASVLMGEGRAADALTLLDEVCRRARRDGDRDIEATALTNQALNHLNAGALVDAATRYDQALLIARELGDRTLEGRIYTNQASLAWRQGDMGRAVALLEEALLVHREVGARYSEAITFSNLAFAYCERGEVQRAVVLWRDAVAMDREIGSTRSEAWNLSHLANANAELGEVDAALDYAAQAVGMARRLADAQLLAHVLTVEIELRRRALGEVDLAALDELSAAAARGGRLALSVIALCQRAHAALALGDDVAGYRAQLAEIEATVEADVEWSVPLATLDAAMAAYGLHEGRDGDDPAALPDGLCAWLARRGQL